MKRFVAVILMSFILSLSVIDAYHDASVSYASAIPTGIDALMWLMQSVMGSQGQSCGSVGDLSGLTGAFEQYMEYLKNGDPAGATRFAAVAPIIGAVRTLKQGDKLSLVDAMPLVKEMKLFLNQMLPSMAKHFGDDDLPVGRFTLDDLADKYFYGMTVKDTQGVLSGHPEMLDGMDKLCFIAARNTSVYYRQYVVYLAPVNHVYIQSDLDKDGNTVYTLCNSINGAPTLWFRFTMHQRYADDKFLETDKTIGTTSGSGIPYNPTGDLLTSVGRDWKLSKINCQYPVYSSWEDYQLCMSIVAHNAFNAYYGDPSKAFDLPEELKVGDLSQTKAVEQVIKENPDMDADALNLLVSETLTKLFEKQQDINASIGDNTAEVEISNSWLSKIYTKITDAFPSLSTPLGAIAKIIADVSLGVDRVGTAIDNLGTDVLAKLKPIDLLLSGFQELSAFLSGILQDIKSGILSIPDAISNLGDISVTLPIPQELLDIRDVVIGIPIALQGLLDDILTIPRNIVLEFEKALTVDDTIVDNATGDLTDTLKLKLPFIPDISNLFQGFHFSDALNYPVISIPVPSILKQFFDTDRIILFNGADYAQYFVYIRGIIRAILWVMFGFSVLKQFRVNFHVG